MGMMPEGDKPEVLCTLEEEPISEGHNNIKVVPWESHKSQLMPAREDETTERKAKEILINRLCRESITVRSSVYLSKTMPI